VTGREVWSWPPSDWIARIRRLEQELADLKQRVDQGEVVPVFTLLGTPGSFSPGPRHPFLHDYILTECWAAVDQAASSDIVGDILVNGSSITGGGVTIAAGENLGIAASTLLEVHRGDYAKVEIVSSADEVDWTLGIWGYRSDTGRG
jgi:hypothetical protein